jgi:hypothetical protein
METKRPGKSPRNEIEEPNLGNLERLSSLRKLVCELLVQNQKLRMELMAQMVESSTDKGSVSLFE